MSSLLQEVTRSGPAARAQAMPKRPETGTTNDAMDAWFAGYNPQVTAVVWIGYDTPRKLGERETGGGLSLPVWISYMETALRSIPPSDYAVPEGLASVGGEWVFDEFARTGVTSLGLGDKTDDKPAVLPAGEEKRRILDLFRN